MAAPGSDFIGCLTPPNVRSSLNQKTEGRRNRTEHRVVTRCTHEEQQRERHPEADARDQETLSRQAGSLLRHGLPGFTALAGPANQLLVDPPYDAPYIQHH